MREKTPIDLEDSSVLLLLFPLGEDLGWRSIAVNSVLFKLNSNPKTALSLT